MAKVREIMTAHVIGIEKNEPVSEAARRMKDADVGDVLVLDGGKLFGILTDRDIVVRVLAEEKDPKNTQVGQICSRDMATVGPDDDENRVKELMRDRAVRRIPVVDNGRPIGMMTLGDLAQKRQPESVMGKISEPIPQE